MGRGEGLGRVSWSTSGGGVVESSSGWFRVEDMVAVVGKFGPGERLRMA